MAEHREQRRPSGNGPDPRQVTRRGRWRTLAFVAITLWLCVAVAVVFFRGLGDAQRSGAAEEVAARYQQYLGAGWFPLEVDAVPPTPSTGEQRWLGLNYSKGSVSTIVPAPDWRTLRVRLASVGCTNHEALSIAVREGSTLVQTFTPGAGWRWYSFQLGSRAQSVTLHYSCLTVEQSPGLGLQSARRLAVVLSGVSGPMPQGVGHPRSS